MRIPKKLLKELDTMTRERAYIEQKRVTRNNLIVQLIETAVQGVKPHDNEPDNLVLELLRAIKGDITGMKCEIV